MATFKLFFQSVRPKDIMTPELRRLVKNTFYDINSSKTLCDDTERLTVTFHSALYTIWPASSIDFPFF